MLLDDVADVDADEVDQVNEIEVDVDDSNAMIMNYDNASYCFICELLDGQASASLHKTDITSPGVWIIPGVWRIT